MYSFPDLERVCCSTSSPNCCFLTCIQMSQQAGQVVWYSHLFQNFPQFMVILTVKAFGIVNKAEDVFLELLLFRWSNGCWQFDLWYLCLSSCTVEGWLENCEHYLASIWDECNCAVVWAFVGIAFLWDWNENWSFPILWPLLSFPNFPAYWVQQFNSIIF